jgi:hypothetical protein
MAQWMRYRGLGPGAAAVPPVPAMLFQAAAVPSAEPLTPGWEGFKERGWAVSSSEHNISVPTSTRPDDDMGKSPVDTVAWHPAAASGGGLWDQHMAAEGANRLPPSKSSSCSAVSSKTAPAVSARSIWCLPMAGPCLRLSLASIRPFALRLMILKAGSEDGPALLFALRAAATGLFPNLCQRVPPPLSAPTLPPGLLSSFLHDRVREGARLAVKAPAGSFHLTDEDAVPVVLIAGSIGLTPLLSMLNSLLHVGSRREIWLFYGGRNAIAPSRTCASIWMRWAGAIRTSD